MIRNNIIIIHNLLVTKKSTIGKINHILKQLSLLNRNIQVKMTVIYILRNDYLHFVKRRKRREGYSYLCRALLIRTNCPKKCKINNYSLSKEG